MERLMSIQHITQVYSRRFATVTARTAWKGTIYPPSPGRNPGSKEHELEGGLVLLEPRELV